MSNRKPTPIDLLRAENARLRADRLALAKLAIAVEKHPRAGFFNPLVAWKAEELALSILNSEVPGV